MSVNLKDFVCLKREKYPIQSQDVYRHLSRSTKSTYKRDLKIVNILTELEISLQDYYWALSVSNDSHYEVNSK